jgi:hypothetical protein
VANEGVDISAGLKRKLKSGKEYSKLIPVVKCERTNLGQGDTFNTVNWMKGWIEKYSFQTKKLSPLLQGRSLESTVNNIYRFLYDHIQYEQDGALQQLRSPACTWAQRRSGVDCKSYSVFASSCLSNLGIKHFIRQIRQANYYQEEFTHVYIVVPVDQNVTNYQGNTRTLVLDATKHQNTESNYIEKADVHMVNLKNVGLNAPSQQEDERVKNVSENFETFSKDLIANGISLDIVNSIRNRINHFTSLGKDPKVKIVPKGIVIEGHLFVIEFPSQKGLGIVFTAAVSAGIAIYKMIPPGFVGDTFGAVFANKFNLSCWGSATSPSQAKGEVAQDGPELYKLSGLEQKIDIKNINTFSMFMQGYIEKRTVWAARTNRAQCTLDGDATGAGLMNEFYLKVMTTIRENLKKNGLQLTTDRIKTMTVRFPLSGDYFNNFSQPDVQVTVFKIESDPDFVGKKEDTLNKKSKSSGSGSNAGLIVGGTALAALPFLFMMKKKDVSEGIKTAKKQASSKTKK